MYFVTSPITSVSVKLDQEEVDCHDHVPTSPEHLDGIEEGNPGNKQVARMW